MHFVAGAVLVRTVGVEVALKCCVSALVSSLQGICTIASSLSTNTSCSQDIKLVLNDLDLVATSQVLHVFISELDIDNIRTKTFSQALTNLKNVVTEIEECLKELEKRHKYNDSLWISYYRSYTFDDIITKLKILKDKSDKRYNLLIETLKVKECLKVNIDNNNRKDKDNMDNTILDISLDCSI